MSSAFRSLRPLLRSKAASHAVVVRRSKHTIVPLPYSIEDGLPPFLSPEALSTVAEQWQGGVLERLNVLTHGTECESLSALQTVKQTASDPTRSTTFNYASEALNNSFFLSTLTPQKKTLNPQSSLSLSINNTFTSYSDLQSRFSSHVAGLHPSSGAYVWLVTDTIGNLGIVGTYAGGTVLVHQRIQMGYGSTEGHVLGEKVEVKEGVEGEKAPSPFKTIAAGTKTGGGDSMASAAFQRGTLNPSANGAAARNPIHPILCLSVHPHCYLKDYGVWGRGEYVNKWWGAIDWTKVEHSYARIVQKSSSN